MENIKNLLHRIQELETENKKLKQAAEFHELYMDNSTSWDTFRNPDGNLIYVSPDFEKMTGYKKDDYINGDISLFEMIHPEDLPKAKENFRKQLDGQSFNNFVCRLININGQENYYSVSSKPVFNKNNEYIGFRTSVNDVTHIKQIETELNESEEKFKTISNFAKDAIIMIDDFDRVIFWNPAAVKMFGYETDEIMGKFLHKHIVSQKYSEQFKTGFEQYKKFGKGNSIGKTIELSALNKNGIEFPVEISLSVTHIKQKQIAIGIIRDISLKKQNEENLKDLLNAKDKFLSILAHDLKNPFNSLLGFSKLMLENNATYDDKTREEFLKSFYTASKNTYNLLENLLAWAGTQSGKLKINKRKHDLNVSLLKIIACMQEQANQKNIKIENYTQQTIYTDSDPNMLETVLRNIVTNAVKYTDRGGKITIDTILQSDFVTVKISDTGTGMTKETLNSIMKTGEKESVSGTEGERGTGLGLVLCKEFIEMHGGKIWEESELGKGSTFFFTVPVYKQN